VGKGGNQGTLAEPAAAQAALISACQAPSCSLDFGCNNLIKGVATPLVFAIFRAPFVSKGPNCRILQR
jgi:hypothetical protein